MNTWYCGDIISSCYDMRTFSLVHRNSSGIETMDSSEFQDWYDSVKTENASDMEFIADEPVFDILVQSEEQDTKNNLRERCTWRWVNKESQMVFEIELSRWTKERYEHF